VQLSDVADNCQVDDDSQGTNVPPGGTGTVNFNIVCDPIPPEDQPPVANPDFYVGFVGEALVIPDGAGQQGLLFNDSDPDNTPEQLTARKLTEPVVQGTQDRQGSLAVNPDGSFTFVPDRNFTGLVTFTYRVTDPAGKSADAEVTINIQ
jgi:hypothetical protein